MSRVTISERVATIPIQHETARYKCWICQDKGLVPIAHPNTVKKARMQGTEALSIGERNAIQMAACNCSAGEHHREGHKHWKPLRAYNPECMCRVVMGGDLETIEAWLDGDNRPDIARDMSNFETGFDNWNRGSIDDGITD